MPDVFATIIVTAGKCEQARSAAATLPGGDGMFTAGLSSSGDEPATHFISSGWVPEEIVQAVAAVSVVSALEPVDVLLSAGLKPCAGY